MNKVKLYTKPVKLKDNPDHYKEVIKLINEFKSVRNIPVYVWEYNKFDTIYFENLENYYSDFILFYISPENYNYINKRVYYFMKDCVREKGEICRECGPLLISLGIVLTLENYKVVWNDVITKNKYFIDQTFPILNNIYNDAVYRYLKYWVDNKKEYEIS